MKCPKCGETLEDGAVYCDHCGEEIHIVPSFDVHFDYATQILAKKVNESQQKENQEASGKGTVSKRNIKISVVCGL